MFLASSYLLVMAILAFKYHIIGDYGVETDFYVFVRQAKLILGGQLPVDGYRGPVYFLILAPLGMLTGDFFRSGMAISLISAAIVLYFTFRLLSHILREDLALAATLLTAVNPTFVQYTYSAGTDMMFFAAMTVAVHYFLKHDGLTTRRTLIAGVLSALAYLIRYNGVFIIAGFVFLLLFVDKRLSGTKDRLAGAATLVAAFLVAITPWGLHCLKHTGDFFYNLNYRNVACTVYAEGRMDWDAFWSTKAPEFQSFLDVVLADPILFFKTMLFNIHIHFLGDMGTLLGWHLGVPVVAGILIAAFGWSKSKASPYMLVNVLQFVVLLTVVYNPRYSLPLIPFYGVLAANSIAVAGAVLLRRSRLVGLSISVAILVLVVWSLVDAFQYNRANISSGPREILIVADWFEENVSPAERGELIVARKPHIAHYLDLEFEWLPPADSHEELIERLRTIGADYLYISVIEATRRPELAYLLDPRRHHSGLIPILFYGSAESPAALYRVE